MANCILIDKIGLSNAVSGSEAKNIIMKKAMIGALLDSRGADIFMPFLVDKLAKIQMDKYYEKADVEACATEAMVFNVLTTNIGGFTCNLREHKMIIDPVL